MTPSAIIHISSLDRAVQNLLDQMKKAGFSNGSRKVCFERLRPIQTFMNRENISEYTPDSLSGEKILKFTITLLKRIFLA